MPSATVRVYERMRVCVCARAPRKDLTPEQRESLGKSIFSDYLASPSVDEAVGAAQELDVGGFMPKLVQVCSREGGSLT